MSDGVRQPLGLVVRAAPFARRSARDDLDVALAAATVETPLEIFFLGDGVWQLAVGHEPGPALLPSGLKGWSALVGLTEIRFFAEPAACRRLSELSIETVVEVEPLDASEMAKCWHACEQVLVL